MNPQNLTSTIEQADTTYNTVMDYAGGIGIGTLIVIAVIGIVLVWMNQ